MRNLFSRYANKIDQQCQCNKFVSRLKLRDLHSSFLLDFVDFLKKYMQYNTSFKSSDNGLYDSRRAEVWHYQGQLRPTVSKKLTTTKLHIHIKLAKNLRV